MRYQYKPKSQQIKDTKKGYTYHCTNKELYKIIQQQETQIQELKQQLQKKTINTIKTNP